MEHSFGKGGNNEGVTIPGTMGSVLSRTGSWSKTPTWKEAGAVGLVDLDPLALLAPGWAHEEDIWAIQLHCLISEDSKGQDSGVKAK